MSEKEKRDAIGNGCVITVIPEGVNDNCWLFVPSAEHYRSYSTHVIRRNRRYGDISFREPGRPLVRLAGEGDYPILKFEVHTLHCAQPEPGCAFFFKYECGDGLKRFQVIAFDGTRWNDIELFRARNIVHEGDYPDAVSIWTGKDWLKTGNGLEIEHILDYWVGKLSLGDLLIIQSRSRLRPLLTQALAETKRLKGALGIRSKTAAEIQRLLEEGLA